MKYLTIATSAALVSSALAATVPSAPWSTLTPTGKIPSSATTDYAPKFGIQIVTVEAAANLSTETAANITKELETALPVRNKAVVNTLSDGQPNVVTTTTYRSVSSKSSVAPVAQITDGQIQHQTTAAAVSVINQITDGQIQHQTTAAPVSVVNQIGDGQIQHQTTAAAVSVVNQIGDGQIQHQTTAAAVSVVNQIGDGQIQHQTTAAPVSVVNQIGDGQIQHQTTAAPASVVNQIGDGQIQHQTTATPSTVAAIAQISDGQIQHQSSKVAPSHVTAAAQLSDGQVQHENATVAAESRVAAVATLSDGQPQVTGHASELESAIPKACSSKNNLIMTLKKGMLSDSKGRVGAIVANRQFQFDGPPPQAGTIFAAGWSISSDGYLTLGDSKVFYQCLSGDFYNLYDKNIAAQCNAVKLKIIDFVDC